MHRYPFRLVERREGTAGVVSLTAGAGWLRGGERLPGGLVFELLAQAALAVLGEGRARAAVALAGIEAGEVLSPVAAGDRLTATATLLARADHVLKVRAMLEREGREVAHATFLLAEFAHDGA